MKFDANTITILKNFSAINPSLQFKEGDVVKTRSLGKDIFAVAKVNESFDADFAIYELTRFLGTLSLFEDPEVELSNKVLTIKQDKKRVKYVCAEPSQIEAADYSKNITMPTPVAKSVLTKQNLDDVLKARAVLRLPQLAFVADGSTIALQALDVKNPTGDVYSVDLGPTTETFRAVLEADNVKILSMDYNIEIAKEGIIHFQAVKDEDGNSVPAGLDYWMTLATSSSFG